MMSDVWCDDGPLVTTDQALPAYIRPIVTSHRALVSDHCWRFNVRSDDNVILTGSHLVTVSPPLDNN